MRALGLLLLLSSGCGGVYYGLEAQSAASRLEEARVLGAESLAPYEYYYAKAHLDQASSEASQGHYSDAARYAETSADYAAQAIEISKSSSGKRRDEGH